MIERPGRVRTTSLCFAIAQQTGARPGQGFGNQGNGTVPLDNGYALPGSLLFRNKAGDQGTSALTRRYDNTSEPWGGRALVTGAASASSLVGGHRVCRERSRHALTSLDAPLVVTCW